MYLLYNAEPIIPKPVEKPATMLSRGNRDKGIGLQFQSYPLSPIPLSLTTDAHSGKLNWWGYNSNICLRQGHAFFLLGNTGSIRQYSSHDDVCFPLCEKTTILKKSSISPLTQRVRFITLSYSCNFKCFLLNNSP